MKPAKVNLASNLPNPAPPRPQQRADSNPPGRDNAPTRNTVLKKPARRRATPARHTGVSTPFTASAVQVLVRCSAVHNNWVVTSYRMKNSDAPCAQLLVLPPCPWYVSVSGGRFLLFLSLFDPMQPRFRAGVILLRLLCFIVFSRVSAERGWPRWDRKIGRILTCQ